MADATKDASLNRRAFKAGIFYIACQLFVRGITFLMTPVFTRLLSQEQYNQYKIFESWLLIFAPVMSLCLWRSVECAKYDVKEKFNEYVSSVQTLSYLSISIFFVIFLIFRKQAEALCGMNDFMLLIAFLYTYAHTSIFYMQRREKQMMRYKASTTLTAATVIPATLLSVLLVVLGKRAGHEADLMYLRIAGYYIPMTIGGFTVAILMAVQGKKLIDRSYWKYALRFSLPLIPEVLSIQIMNQADKLMVTRMTGDIPGSIFAVATTVSYIIWILEDSVWNAWLPWMYEKIARNEAGEIRGSWSTLMHGFGVISWVLVLFAPEIILILGGKKYADAIWLIAPMVTGTLFRFYSYSYTAIQNFPQEDEIRGDLDRIRHVPECVPELCRHPRLWLPGCRLHDSLLLPGADDHAGLHGKAPDRHTDHPALHNALHLLCLLHYLRRNDGRLPFPFLGALHPRTDRRADCTLVFSSKTEEHSDAHEEKEMTARPPCVRQNGAVALTCGSSFYISNTKRRASKSPAFVV